MEVIKKGRSQRGWSKKFKCTGAGNGGGGCGAILLVSEYDLYETSHGDYSGDTEYYVTFCCPECGVETDVTNTPEPKGKRPPGSEMRRKALKKTKK